METGKHRIVEATIALLQERGATGTTTDRVAVAAGCAKGLVHYHFGSKASLWSAVLEDLAKLPGYVLDGVVRLFMLAMNRGNEANDSFVLIRDHILPGIGDRPSGARECFGPAVVAFLARSSRTADQRLALLPKW